MTNRLKLLPICAGAIAAIPFVLPQLAAADDDEEVVSPAVAAYRILQNAPDSAWRSIDLDNILLMDLPSGTIAIEMRPDFAPAHVTQIKTLVRAGFYDGLKFHRVIEGFMAQGGDPKGDGTGQSELPNIPPEFAKQADSVDHVAIIGRDRIASRVGFVDGLPVAAEPVGLGSFLAEREPTLWPTHCPGVMSMARANDPGSANSQFFLMIGDSRLNLDTRYTVWGLIIDGNENARRINRGEPPERPTPLVRMRIASDVPESERPKVEVFDTNSQLFMDYLETAGLVKGGFVKDLCNIKTPRRVEGKIEL